MPFHFRCFNRSEEIDHEDIGNRSSNVLCARLDTRTRPRCGRRRSRRRGWWSRWCGRRGCWRRRGSWRSCGGRGYGLWRKRRRSGRFLRRCGRGRRSSPRIRWYARKRQRCRHDDPGPGSEAAEAINRQASTITSNAATGGGLSLSFRCGIRRMRALERLLEAFLAFALPIWVDCPIYLAGPSAPSIGTSSSI